MSEKLSDVVTIISGGTPKTSVKEFWDGNIDWLAVADFNSSNRYVSSASKKITELGLNNSNTKMLEKGDLIISARGTVGAIAQLTKPMAFNQSCFGLRGKKNKLDTDYLYYWLKNYVDVLLNKSQGSVFNTINLSTFDDIKIELPSIADQRKISNLLTLLDDKIEINNQINQELEAMAKTLYDYWFVQFDFPDQNGKPYKSSGGKMVYNPELKREIPEGWGVESVGNLLDKVTKAEKIENNSIEFIGEIPVIDQSQKYIAGFTNNENAILQPQDGHVIFGDHTRVVKYINFDYARGADGTQVLISNNENISNVLLYHMIEDFDLSNYGYARHFKFLKEKTVIVPDKEVSSKFETQANVIYEKIKNNIFENQELTQLRDWLLPMLMNGQVKVE
ncbi:restriction endonuclease subunit S [Streptococcus thermophilus]|uniref:restriction endonuclease subunit S n=1 Tax=Streptococcus thermophilus TaxID=1308 RepID=UPI0012E9EDAE|nr:restriction endonuclease subunit S [Streptococcus thermophilus]MCT2904918.1 restriction endonuclease subunit S [Streptococcus thermophilus]MCT2924529.1 restriction endonuclease subunit S [Streptococcus thermophilus]MCT2925846.1 restriction endonuclease subunit S [Streptococcus thermophilus]MUV66981.1 restriction endonuclease subunit S [Streptococcus thermophilus]WDT83068.1 restriction endonuclease subunit S [Streptococcus thermophilus]